MANAIENTSGSVPRARWLRIGVMLFLIYLVAFMDRSNISVAAPAMSHALGLGSAAIGVLLSAFFWGYVITQVPGGLLAGKFGPKKIICITLIVWGLSAIATGLAPNFESLIAMRFIMGLAEGAVWPSFGVFFASWYPTSERGRAVNFSEMALPVSSIIMAPTAGWLIETFNYHWMFIAQGIPAFIMAIVFWRFADDTPESDKRITVRERDFIIAGRDLEDRPGSFIKDVLGKPISWAFALIYFLWLVGLYSFGLWLPSLVSQASKLNILLVGLVSAVPFIVAAVAMFLNARASDKSKRGRAWFVGIPLFIAAVALFGSQAVSGNLIASIVLLCLAGIGLYAGFGPWWAWVLQHYTRNLSGTTLGFVNLFGNFGGIIGPIVVGLVGASGHLAAGFSVLGYFLLAATILIVVVTLLARNSTKQAGRSEPLGEPDSATVHTVHH